MNIKVAAFTVSEKLSNTECQQSKHHAAGPYNSHISFTHSCELCVENR